MQSVHSGWGYWENMVNLCALSRLPSVWLPLLLEASNMANSFSKTWIRTHNGPTCKRQPLRSCKKVGHKQLSSHFVPNFEALLPHQESIMWTRKRSTNVDLSFLRYSKPCRCIHRIQTREITEISAWFWKMHSVSVLRAKFMSCTFIATVVIQVRLMNSNPNVSVMGEIYRGFTEDKGLERRKNTFYMFCHNSCHPWFLLWFISIHHACNDVNVMKIYFTVVIYGGEAQHVTSN